MCDCFGPTEEEIAALIAAAVAEAAAALFGAQSLRVVTAAVATLTLNDTYFPTLADPRTVLIILGATTTSVVVPDGLTQPVGALVLFKQTTSVATYSKTGAAVLDVPLTTENKSGGVNTQQVLTSTANDTWVLGGRTSA